ncbi:MAG: ATP-binding cassette domain-containing protein, partial [Pseudonocardiaceae bacterium]
VLDIPAAGFASGSTTAVFGPNGSGKTTLLRLIAGLERPTLGAIRLGDGVTAREQGSVRPIAFSFQEAVFLRGSVRANLDLGLRLRGIPEPERRARIAEVAAECGIAHVLERPARKLSGGEAQRVNLARVLALRAPVTLLDEPLAGIDRIARTQLLDDLPRLLATFATTTILVTHDREEAFRLADHLVIVVDGTVRAAGPKAEVYGCPPNRETAELLGYTVLPAVGRTIGIPPGGLRPGRGPLEFVLRVERVIDMGNHYHVLGSIAGARVDLRLPAGLAAPPPGAEMTVSVGAHVVLPS